MNETTKTKTTKTSKASKTSQDSEITDNIQNIKENQMRYVQKIKQYITYFLAAYCILGVILTMQLPWFLAAVAWSFIAFDYLNESEWSREPILL